jgi:hypothetical protein
MDEGVNLRNEQGNLGVRLGNWLTADEAEALLDAADVGTIRGKHRRAYWRFA